MTIDDLVTTAPVVDERLIKALGRSELLGTLRPILDDAGLKAIVGDLLQFHVIIDTNIVMSDLYFMVRRRERQNTEPTVKELLTSKMIVAYFPREALLEVQEKCETMAR